MNQVSIQKLQLDVSNQLAAKQLIKLCGVKQLVGMSRSSIYAAISAGTFPKSISLGLRSVAWLSSDISEWIDSKVAASKAVA